MAEPRRVLVIEDEEAIRAIVADVLLDEGYDVRAVQNGQEALDLLPEWRPDAIVLDLMMPVMDGRAFRAAQRQLPHGLSEIPVIVLSGARETQEWRHDLAVAAVIPKPFDIEEVVAAIRRGLGTG